MTRKDPLKVAKAILEGAFAEEKMSDKEMKMEMDAMKEAMMKHVSEQEDMTEEDVNEMMAKMEAMSYKEMKEMMKKEGIKYESYVSEEEEEDLEESSEEPEVNKRKTDEPEATRGDTESDLETLKKAKSMKKVSAGTIKKSNAGSEVVDKPSQLPMKEDLDALFNGEDLSEDFREKAEVIFEAAVKMRVESIREEIAADAEAQLEESKEEFRSELSEKLDDYLSYVVEEWMKDNQIAIEKGLRADLAESFMTGLKNLFEDHYITVPDEKYDILEGLYAKVEGLENKLNEQIERNTELRKDALVSRCINVFTEVSEGLTDVEEEKLRSLAEGLEFDDEDSFRDKLTVLRENYFNTINESSDMVHEISGDLNEEVEEETPVKLNESMKFYSDMLSRSALVEQQTKMR